MGTPPSPAPWLTPPLSASLWLLSSKIYMADLESALHYILRVEVGKFSVLEGQRLVALKKFMAVLAQVSRTWSPLSPQLWEVRAWPSPSSLRSSWSGYTSGPAAVPGHHGLLPCSLSCALQPPCTDSNSPVQGRG